MTGKSNKKRLVLDSTVGAAIAVGEALDVGNRREVLDSLRIVGAILANGHLPAEGELRWIGRVLEQIGMQAMPMLDDADAHGRPVDARAFGRLVLRELGLSRKTRRSLQVILDRDLMVGRLQGQGLTREEALDLVARFNLETGQLDAGPDGEALKKAIARISNERRRRRGTP